MNLYKKLLKIILIIMMTFTFGVGQVNALDVNTNNVPLITKVQRLEGSGAALNTGVSDEEKLTCEDAEVIEAVRIFSYAINIIKTIIPLLLIISTVKNLVNAILAQDDGEIKKLSGTFIKKFIISVFIFFVPTIVNVFVGMVKSYDDSKAKYSNCADCLTNLAACDQYMGSADISEDQFTNMCNSLFGDPNDPSKKDTAYFLQVALDVVKYSGIIACVALTIVDFAKAVIGDDKDMLKPLSQKMFNRMIYAVILFFLPIITEVLLRMIGVYGTCSLR